MNVDDFIEETFPRKRQSIWIMVTGKNQSGKTDYILYMMEILYELGLMDAFGSNMPMEAPFPVDFIQDFETLEKTCRMLNPNPNRKGLKKYFFFGSEMGKWLPKDQAWKNVEFIAKLQTVRKYGLNWAGDAISRVDSRALNEMHFNGEFRKITPNNPRIAYYDNWESGERIYLYDIPRTKIKFDTFYSANFYMHPQGEGIDIALNKDHEIAFKYLDNDCSWKKVGIDTQTGRRSLIAVLKTYRDMLRSGIIHEPIKDNAISEPSTAIKQEIA